MAIELGTAYISILPSTDRLASGIKRELAGVEREAALAGDRAGRGFGSKFKGALGGFLKGGVLAGITGASLLAGAGLKTAAELEQTQIGFETMLGSAEKADKFLAQIKKTAAKTPFELPGLTSASQKLLAFGFQAKDVIPTLTTLGDAAAGLGLGQEGLDRIIMAVGQIQAKGKIQGEELLQLTEAGIPAQKILQNELGLTADQYEELQKQGKLTADKVIPALLNGIQNGTKGIAGQTAKFGGLMEKQSKSLSGLFSTLKDTVLVGMADAIQPLMPMLKGGLRGAIKGLTPLFGGLAKGVESVTNAFKGGGGSWGETLSRTGAAVRDFVSGLLPTLREIGGKIMGALGPGLKEIGETVRTKFLPAFERLLPILQPVAKFLLQMFGSAVVGVIKGAVQAVKGFITVVSGVFDLVVSLVHGDWSGAWEALKSIFSGAIDFVVGALKVWWNLGILAIFRQGIKFLVKGWTGLWNGIKSLASKGFKWIEGIIRKGLGFVARLFVNGIKAYVRFWKGLFTGLKNLAVEGWKALRSAFGGALAAIRTIVSRAITGYVNFWRNLFETLKSAASRGWDLIKSGFTKALDAIKSAFRKGVDAIKKIWDGLKEAASKPVRFVVDTLYNNGIRKMIGYLPGVGEPPAVSLGFARGGWTGPGGKYQPAGIVHADEFVIRKESRQRFEREHPGALDYLNKYGRLPGFFLGGRVPLPGATSVSQHSGYSFAQWAGDLNAPNDLGKPVVAWKSGFVAGMHYIGDRSYGRYVTLNHGGNSSLYAHLSRFGPISVGQAVKAGQTIGYVGSVGNSSGPHLHFEVRGGSAPSGSTNVGGGHILAMIPDLIAKAKEIWGGLKELGSSGWAGLLKDAMKNVLGDLKGWVNDKVPGPGPIPGGIFDNGGVLEPGMAAVNLSKKPEAIFNHRQFKSFAETAAGANRGPRRVVVQIGQREFEGYMRDVAEDTYHGERAYAATTRRMGGR